MSKRVLALALVFVATSASGGQREPLSTTRECWAALRALPDPSTIEISTDKNWKPYQRVLDSPFCRGSAVSLARRMLLDHPELKQ